MNTFQKRSSGRRGAYWRGPLVPGAGGRAVTRSPSSGARTWGRGAAAGTHPRLQLPEPHSAKRKARTPRDTGLLQAGSFSRPGSPPSLCTRRPKGPCAGLQNTNYLPENTQDLNSTEQAVPSALWSRAPRDHVAPRAAQGQRHRGRRYLKQLAEQHRRVSVGLRQDAPGDHLAVVEGLRGKPHLSQAAAVDELNHLRQTDGRAERCYGPPPGP